MGTQGEPSATPRLSEYPLRQSAVQGTVCPSGSQRDFANPTPPQQDGRLDYQRLHVTSARICGVHGARPVPVDDVDPGEDTFFASVLVALVSETMNTTQVPVLMQYMA
ncbi:hypothetical protein L917_11078 [Phytophthora nicotianae]|uniref:Uncharacterized protein n=1 Tax=Phytophthora nicotianae TaxID=4792 RepID=W2KZV7_PHYNI|nr:hypothetical protein L917_11078 [Phytophthora nicotianae]